MSSTSTHDVQQQGNTVCGSRAPPPTPTTNLQGNSSSGILNNDAFAAFLEKSLGISSLVLPVRNNVSECDIPVIDLLSGGDSSERDCLIRSLAKSASEFGCFQVINHGIPSDLVERVERECAGLFEVPLEKKEIAARNPGAPFGYDENGSDASTSVRLESFWLETDAGLLEEFIRNIWPEGSASFRFFFFKFPFILFFVIPLKLLVLQIEVVESVVSIFLLNTPIEGLHCIPRVLGSTTISWSDLGRLWLIEKSEAHIECPQTTISALRPRFGAQVLFKGVEPPATELAGRSANATLHAMQPELNHLQLNWLGDLYSLVLYHFPNVLSHPCTLALAENSATQIVHPHSPHPPFGVLLLSIGIEPHRHAVG